MKIRTGFVSNSSSSSFLIAVKNEICPHCNNGSPFLGLLESLKIKNDYDGSKAFSAEQIIRDFKNEIEHYRKIISTNTKYEAGYKKEIVEFNTRIEKINKFQENNEWKVYSLQIDYNDNWLECLMRDQEKSGSLKIIERD